MNFKEEGNNEKTFYSLCNENKEKNKSDEENSSQTKRIQKTRGRKPKDCYTFDEDGNQILIPEFKSVADDINSDPFRVNYEVLKEEIIENEYFKKWFVEIFPKKRANNNAIIPYVFKERSNADIRARENEMTEEFQERVLFVNKKKKQISFPEIKWEEKTKKEFKENFEIYGKNFSLLSKLINKPIKECIQFYYRIKKITNLKKKVIKYTDDQLKLIIETEWNENEMNLFNEWYIYHNGSINKFSNLFPNKDIKLYLRYYNKFIIGLKEEKEETKEIIEIPSLPEIKEEKIEEKTKPRKIENPQEILQRWTADERQIFAIYYPYFQKNWILYSEHIKTKKISDFSKYFRHYFKKLTYNERLFETYLKELHFDTFRKIYTERKRMEDKKHELFTETCGILFLTQ